MAATLRWSSVDALLRGPHEPPPEAAERPFEVEEAFGGLGLGRVVSGEAWPGELPRLDRIAPFPAHTSLRGVRDAEVVLWGETGGARAPLCSFGEGGARFAFDPARWLRDLLAERYVGRFSRPLPSRVPGLNYARLPHALKGVAERLLAKLPPPALAPFPELPLDTFVEHVRRLCQVLAGGAAAPPVGLWPDGRKAALTLTHDVDTGWILDPARAGLLREILERENALGFRGAWYVVGARLDPGRHRAALGAIVDAGHELGVHGWNHDARLGFVGEAAQERRLGRARARFGGVSVSGIRTPWYWRSAELFPVLARHFAYDSSVPSASDLYGTTTRTGCCSVFPYAPHPELVELPLTLPPDTALEAEDLATTWGTAADEIVDLGGVVVPILHPQPHQSARDDRLDAYFRALARIAGRHGGALWSAPPAEVVERYRSAVSPC